MQQMHTKALLLLLSQGYNLEIYNNEVFLQDSLESSAVFPPSPCPSLCYALTTKGEKNKTTIQVSL